MTGRFRLRPTRPTGLRTHADWTIKWYEITLDGHAVDPSIVAAAERCATTSCAAAAQPVDGLRIGFAMIHHGAESVWVLVDLWSGDIASQTTWSAPLDDPARFTQVPAGGPTACVWELSVHGHERDALVRHVLDPHDGPHVDAYLADTMTIEPEPTLDSRQITLEAFDAAWAGGDVDGLMRLMSDDPTYRASTGDGPGRVFRGVEAVAAGFAEIIAAEQSAGSPQPIAPLRIELFEDGGAASWWSYTTVAPDGSTAAVEGVDIWTFDGGKIACKDAYRKSFPDA